MMPPPGWQQCPIGGREKRKAYTFPPALCNKWAGVVRGIPAAGSIRLLLPPWKHSRKPCKEQHQYLLKTENQNQIRMNQRSIYTLAARAWLWDVFVLDQQQATLNQGGNPVVIGLWPWFIFYLAHLRSVFAQQESRFHRTPQCKAPFDRVCCRSLRCAYFAVQFSRLWRRSGLLRSESAILCRVDGNT